MIASFARYWAPLIVYMGVVFWASSRSRPESVDVIPDFGLHGAAYFVLTLLAVRALGKGLFAPVSLATLTGAIAIAVAYGASDEWHQSFVLSRDGSIADFLFDVMGALLAAAALHVFWWWRSPEALS